MADDSADSLREMAQHRGLKLVRSRRRKPGTGDFGKFGLIDEKGEPLLGIGEDGLTASAEDIEDYLRAGAASTWQQSAKITPDRPAPRKDRKRGDTPAASVPQRRRPRPDRLGAAQAAADTKAGNAGASEAKVGEPDTDDDRPTKAASAPKSRRSERASHARSRGAVGDRKSSAPDKGRPDRAAPGLRTQAETARPEAAEPEPLLVLRPARPADAEALATLLGELKGLSPSKGDVARDLAALRKAGGGAHIAEFGSLVGCVAWSVLPTLQRGSIGRISALVVCEDHRRQGIGTQLLAVAEAALAKRGCALLEAMSDIDIRNSHNFFRTAKFEQTSYRFARKVTR